MKIKIPATFPVQPLKSGAKAKDRVTCGTCGLSWDDAIPTTRTPAPSGRCPFEYFHAEEKSEPVTDDNEFLVKDRKKLQELHGIAIRYQLKLEHKNEALVAALEAIRARINGVFDDPHLMKHGHLDTNSDVDILKIIGKALAEGGK